MEIGGRVAIVTGGGTGIGRAVGVRLARAGAAAVVVNYSRSEDEAVATAKEIESLGAQAYAHRADVSYDPQVVAMIDETVKRFGRLDVLVNNAGTTHFIPHSNLDALTDEVWNDILGVNLKGTFFCCRAAAPELRKFVSTRSRRASCPAAGPGNGLEMTQPRPSRHPPPRARPCGQSRLRTM